MDELGTQALSIKPEKWRHAETENFIVHFQRVTEAKIVVREIEYDLWYVATTLGANKEQYRKKSHVFVFEDEKQWKDFLKLLHGSEWMGSFALHDELFLSVRNMQRGGLFNSNTLAHETTHAVVARLYPTERWPVWLSEGFAENMGNASVASHNHEQLKKYQRNLNNGNMTLDELFAVQKYPDSVWEVDRLYQSSEMFVRYLLNELPKDRFHRYVSEILATNDPKQSLVSVYGDKIKDFETFKKKYDAFTALKK